MGPCGHVIYLGHEQQASRWVNQSQDVISQQETGVHIGLGIGRRQRHLLAGGEMTEGRETYTGLNFSDHALRQT